MKDIGFTNIIVEANGNWFDYMIQEIKRVPYMATRYAGKRNSFLYKIAVVPILMLLAYLNKTDNNSNELLCFGYHVTARKPE